MSHPLPVSSLAVLHHRIANTTRALADPDAYTADQRASVAAAALQLHLAAGPIRHAVLVDQLADAQAELDSEPTEARAVRVVGLCDELLAKVNRQRADGVDAMCRAQARAVYAADPHRSQP